MWVDTHCHLDKDSYIAPDGTDTTEQVLRRACDVGVSQMILIGTGEGLTESQQVIHWAERHSFLHAAIGVHPHDAKQFTIDFDKQTLDDPHCVAQVCQNLLYQKMFELAHHPKVVAIGEIGLDYHYNHSTPAVQQSVFRAFLRMAIKLGLPVSLHIRDAHQDALMCVQQEAPHITGVVHCFTGTQEEAFNWINLGFHISFSGILTFKAAHSLKEVCKAIPLEKIVMETDSPYLTPVPLRGRPNEPAFLLHTAAVLAQIKGISLEKLAHHTTATARKLFRI